MYMNYRVNLCLDAINNLVAHFLSTWQTSETMWKDYVNKSKYTNDARKIYRENKAHWYYNKLYEKRCVTDALSPEMTQCGMRDDAICSFTLIVGSGDKLLRINRMLRHVLRVYECVFRTIDTFLGESTCNASLDGTN